MDPDLPGAALAGPGTAPPAPITRLHVVQRTGSTNSDLVNLATADPPAWPHLSVLMARSQTAGKGRAGRVWDSASLRALTFSVLVRPQVDRTMWGWIPLLAGLAAVRAVRAQVRSVGAAGGAPGSAVTGGERVALKWPNDVVDTAGGTTAVSGWGRMRKLGGILTEVLPDGGGAVVGIGLNLEGPDLPVPWAGTVQQAVGPDPERTGPAVHAAIASEPLLHAIVSEFAPVLHALERGEHVRHLVQQVCVSIGSQVQVDLPGDAAIRGTVTALAHDGALVVRTEHGDQTVRAGDVRHLRSTTATPPAPMRPAP